MHELMGDWYGETDLKCTPDRLEKRWVAIGEFLKIQEPSGVYILDLVRLFFGLPQKDKSIHSILSEQVKGIDPSFRIRKNSFELRLLSGIILIHLIEESEPHIINILSLALICGEFQGLRSNLPIADAPAIALATLSEISARQRMPEPQPLTFELPKRLISVAKNVTEGTQESNWEIAKDPIGNSLSNLIEGIKEFHAISAKVVGGLNKTLQCQQEEVNILWWLFGGVSRDLKVAFSDLEACEASLAIGKELADLVIMVPGPLPVEAFIREGLKSVLESHEPKLTLKEIAMGGDVDWKKDVVNSSKAAGFEDLIPLHLVLVESIRPELEANWLTTFSRKYKLQSRSRVSPEQLAIQIYLERLLARSLVKTFS